MTTTVPNRKDHAPVFSWDAGAGPTYVQLDCIPTFRDSKGGQVTNFALEDGTTIGDHFIKAPQIIQMQIVQTPTPIDVAINSVFGESPMEWKVVDLKVPASRFEASGLLLVMTAASGLVDDAVGAIGSLLGLDPPPAPKVHILKSTTEEDRINACYDDLSAAYDVAAQITFDWLNRSWSGFVLEKIDYTRTKGKQAGVFDISLKKVDTVTTEQTEVLTLPAELTLQGVLPGGQQPGVTYQDVEADIVKKSLQEGNPKLKIKKDSPF